MAEMTYVETHRYRPFDLISPRFVDIDDDQLQLDGRHSDGLRLLEAGPAVPFAAVELRVRTIGDDAVLAGFASAEGGADGAHLLATYDAAATQVTLELRTGESTRVVGIAGVRLTPPFGFALVLCENQATALADTGDGWQPLVTARRGVAAFLDFRDAGVLKRFRYAYGVRSGQRSRTPTSIARVRAGLFGRAGVRDPHVVQTPDGTPYVRDGKLYLTLTCAGMGFFQQAHWGVFTLDLSDLSRLEQVAHLYFTRDGKVLGDHAGQLIVDGDTITLLVSAWGDFQRGSVHVRHCVTTGDVLSGAHLLSTQRLELPTELPTWDPALTSIDDRWYVGFVASPNQVGRFDLHPALAASPPGGAYTDLSLVGADDDLHQCEGTILARLPDTMVSSGSAEDSARPDGGSPIDAGAQERPWRLLASDGDARAYPVYDLTMRRVGSLAAPYGSNIPHPQVVTVPGPAGQRDLLITFDGTQYGESVLGYGGHGDLVILEAQPAP